MSDSVSHLLHLAHRDPTLCRIIQLAADLETEFTRMQQHVAEATQRLLDYRHRTVHPAAVVAADLDTPSGSVPRLDHAEKCTLEFLQAPPEQWYVNRPFQKPITVLLKNDRDEIVDVSGVMVRAQVTDPTNETVLDTRTGTPILASCDAVMKHGRAEFTNLRFMEVSSKQQHKGFFLSVECRSHPAVKATVPRPIKILSKVMDKRSRHERESSGESNAKRVHSSDSDPSWSASSSSEAAMMAGGEVGFVDIGAEGGGILDSDPQPFMGRVMVYRSLEDVMTFGTSTEFPPWS